MSDLNSVQEQLAKPFDETEIKWKPQVTTKGRNKEPIMRGDQQVAGCTAHIDARAVMNRLDDVVGVGGWSDTYKVLDGKHVECTLTVMGISKSDVGETNEGGFADPIKSAYSDALKRAAVKFGIGRHLYDMEMEWLPFDGYRIIEAQAPQKDGRKQQKGKATNGKKESKHVVVAHHAYEMQVTGINRGGVTDSQTKPTPDMLKALHAAGNSFYGGEWDVKRKDLVHAITKGRSDSSKHLTRDECQKLIDGIAAKADSNGQ